MPRTAVTPTKVTNNTAVTVATTNADVSNGHSVNLNGVRRKMVLQLTNTAESSKNVTVKGSLSFPGTSGADLTVAVPATSTRLLSIDDTSRFSHVSGGVGYLHVDLESGFTGTIAALNTDPHPLS